VKVGQSGHEEGREIREVLKGQEYMLKKRVSTSLTIRYTPCISSPEHGNCMCKNKKIPEGLGGRGCHRVEHITIGRADSRK
jgi:hypothetical protein